MEKHKIKIILVIYLVIIPCMTTSLSAQSYQLQCHYVDTRLYNCGGNIKSGERQQDVALLVMPVKNAKVTALFHTYPDENIVHRGIDIIGDLPVYAAANGVVVERCQIACGSYGQYIIVQHQQNLFTLYAHLSQIAVNLDDVVFSLTDTRHQPIGQMRNTGNSQGVHLHFEVRNSKSNAYTARLDPVDYLHININECDNMFGLVDALYSFVHRYQQWYQLTDDGYVICR